MRIAIFGCSFSEENHGFHWSNLLRNKLLAEVDNYAESGSSVYYSYKKFIEVYKNYDLNIFQVSHPNRYFKPIYEYKRTHTRKMHVTSYRDVEFLLKNKKDLLNPMTDDTRILEDLKGWFLSSDDIFNNDMVHLMVDKMIELDPNVIIFPAFDISISNKQYDMLGLEKTNNLINLLTHQFNQLDVTLSDSAINTFATAEDKKVIDGHFTPEYNKIICDIMINRIKNNKWDWTLPDKVKFKYTVDTYYSNR